MNTLDLAAAAAFLGLHPDTLAERARAGIIPGAKPGKEWRFLSDDLTAYLRSLYPCRSINARARPSGITTSDAPAGDDFDEALAQAIERKRNASTTRLQLVSGKSGKAAAGSSTRSMRGSRRKSAAAKNSQR